MFIIDKEFLIKYCSEKYGGNINDLTEIDLSYQKIVYFNKDTFSGLTNLKKLYLNSNRICELDDDLFVDCNLKCLPITARNAVRMTAR